MPDEKTFMTQEGYEKTKEEMDNSPKKNEKYEWNLYSNSKSIREYKRPSILTPLLVAIEVVIECLIPYIMTLLLDKIKTIAENGNTEILIEQILKYGGLLLVLALLSLLCGVYAGKLNMLRNCILHYLTVLCNSIELNFLGVSHEL